MLVEWYVADREPVREGQAVCVVETSKSAIEIVSPGEGSLGHLYRAGDEVELGRPIALVAADEAELDAALAGRERPAAAPAATLPAEGGVQATRKAIELAERHGVDLASLGKPGIVTAEDVEALVGAAPAARAGEADTVLAGLSTDGVTLPACFGLPPEDGVLDPAFLASLRDDPGAFAELPAAERLELYRSHGARLGEDVRLGRRTVVVSPRVVLGDGVSIGDDSLVTCDEVFAVDALTAFGPGLSVRCRRAFVGANGWIGHNVRIGGGGSRDPWATLVVGDLAFIGEQAFLNPCRPVLIGREVFLTMRSLLVTHNIGHSVLEGFENRFAGIVLEDRAQIGLGTVVYAGCRIGREAIVGSNSYVVADVPPGKLALGVPAKVVHDAKRALSPERQRELARRLLDELGELLELRGLDVARVAHGAVQALEVELEGATSLVVLVERLTGEQPLPEGPGERVALTLELVGEPPPDCTVFDLLAREVHGPGGPLAEAVREFCRKRGIRFEPGPWRYRGALI